MFVDVARDVTFWPFVSGIVLLLAGFGLAESPAVVAGAGAFALFMMTVLVPTRTYLKPA